MAVDEVGSVGGQEHGGSLQIIGCTPAGGGGFGNDELIEGMPASVGLPLAQGRGLRRFDIARPDAVALDVVRAVFGADVAREHLQAALGRGIGGNGFAAQLGHHGADVDDFSVTFLDHRGDDGLGADEGGVEVHVDDLAEIVGAHLRHGDALDDARVVDQNVDDADLVLHVCHQGLHRAFISHVADVAMGPDALFCIGGQPLVHQLLTDVVKDDGSTRGGKCLRNGETDAVGAARYPGDFTLQGKSVHIHEKPSSLVIVGKIRNSRIRSGECRAPSCASRVRNVRMHPFDG